MRLVKLYRREIYVRSFLLFWEQESKLHLSSVVSFASTTNDGNNGNSGSPDQRTNIRVALGIRGHLRQFATRMNVQHWEQWARSDPDNWRSAFMEVMNETTNDIFFNLDDVEIWPGILRGSSGHGSSTDWELFQIYQNEGWWNRITDPNITNASSEIDTGLCKKGSDDVRFTA